MKTQTKNAFFITWFHQQFQVNVLGDHASTVSSVHCLQSFQIVQVLAPPVMATTIIFFFFAFG
jgi:hypothetical protein